MPFVREDGRSSTELRALSATFSALSLTDGSASFSFGSTCALAGMHGPIEVRLQQEKNDRACLEVMYLPAAGLTDTRSRAMESPIRASLEALCLLGRFPRTLIQVAIQGVSAEGSELAAAVNTAVLALVDGGVPMSDLLVAVACCIMEDGTLLLDPSTEEGQKAASVHTIGFDGSNRMLLVSSQGNFSEDQMLEAMEACRQGSTAIRTFIRATVQGRMKSLHPDLGLQVEVKE